MYITIGFVILTIFYLLYIQYSPGMGDIWYRNNEYYCFMGAWKVMIFPLQNTAMWNISMWDINYFIWVIFYVLIIILHYLRQNYLLHHHKYN